MAYLASSETTTTRGSERALRDRIGALAQVWIVSAPGRVAPWVPSLADALADGAWTAAWRTFATLSPVVALALGAAAPSLWPAVDHQYADSPLFLMMAIAGAIISGPAGVMFLFGYAFGDVARGGGELERQFANSSAFGAIAKALRGGGSQFLGYLLLAIPVVSLPRFAASLARSFPVKLPSRPLARVPSRLVLYPLVCALVVFLWSQAMTVLMRPLYVWRDLPFTAQSVETFRTQWGWLVATAFVAALARILVEELVQRSSAWRSAVARARRMRRMATARRSFGWNRLPLPIQVALPAGLTTFVLSGLYEGWSDAALVGIVATALSTWRIGFRGRLPSDLSQRIHRVPPLIRVLGVLLVGYGGYVVLQQVAPSLAAASPSRPLLAGAVWSLVASQVAFPSRRLGPLAAGSNLRRLPVLPL